ncbi:MAG: GDP-L-fucose synthase [Deltaproteobacteria bacterium]|nr:GDP-L-fucose synthase [Deltaproteobacteria bacterium]
MADLKYRKVYLAGHTGLVGSALVRRFSRREGIDLVTATRAELDLTDGRAVESFLQRVRPDIVLVAAGRVGGILANSLYPAEFAYQNLMIQANLIHGSWKAGVNRLVNFGSACMYPRDCRQPMSPDALLSGKLEPTSEPYAIAKLAGLSLCSSYNRQYGTNYITAVPCNLYGPGDVFEPTQSHVIAALLLKFHKARAEGARSVEVWGDGRARREFLYVDDLAEACELLVRSYQGAEPINIGSGQFSTVSELAQAVAAAVEYKGEIRWDVSRPAGAPDKLLDSSAVKALGWSPRTDLRAGLEQTYAWFLANHAS